jgi:hypothetical protein
MSKGGKKGTAARVPVVPPENAAQRDTPPKKSGRIRVFVSTNAAVLIATSSPTDATTPVLGATSFRGRHEAFARVLGR